MGMRGVTTISRANISFAANACKSRAEKVACNMIDKVQVRLLRTGSVSVCSLRQCQGDSCRAALIRELIAIDKFSNKYMVW